MTYLRLLNRAAVRQNIGNIANLRIKQVSYNMCMWMFCSQSPTDWFGLISLSVAASSRIVSRSQLLPLPVICRRRGWRGWLRKATSRTHTTTAASDPDRLLLHTVAICSVSPSQERGRHCTWLNVWNRRRSGYKTMHCHSTAQNSVITNPNQLNMISTELNKDANVQYNNHSSSDNLTNNAN